MPSTTVGYFIITDSSIISGDDKYIKCDGKSCKKYSVTSKCEIGDLCKNISFNLTNSTEYSVPFENKNNVSYHVIKNEKNNIFFGNTKSSYGIVNVSSLSIVPTDISKSKYFFK